MALTAPKEIRFKEHCAFDFYHYTSIEEAEQRSGNIGFPIFSCDWLPDGTVLLAGGGGSKGRDVRSAIVACRVVNGLAVDSFFPDKALVDPLALAQGTSPIPSVPMLQAVGEVTTADSIVSALHTIHSPTSTATKLCAAAGGTVVLFDINGFGSLASSNLPACRDLAKTSDDHLQYFLSVRKQTLETNQAAMDLNNKPTLPFSTPFKSPLLSQSFLNQHNQRQDTLSGPSSLSSVIDQLTRVGKRGMTTGLRFRADFSPVDSFVSCVKLSRCGNILFTGGQDGAVRAFWLSDPKLINTKITHGTEYRSNDGTSKLVCAPSTPANRKASHRNRVLPSNDSNNDPNPTDIGYVSPLHLSVAYRADGIKDFQLSYDERLMVVIDDRGGMTIWPVPALRDIQQRGKRIDIDYVDTNGEIVEYPNKSSQGDFDMSLSRSQAQADLDSLSPLLDNPVPKGSGLEHVKSIFWTFPVVNNVVTNNLYQWKQSHSLSITDDNNFNEDSDDGDEPIIPPPNLHDQLEQINTHPSRTTPNAYYLITLVKQGRTATWLCRHVIETDPQTQKLKIRVATQIKVFDDASGTQLMVSPNGHFIAVAGNDLHVYTGPDNPNIRTAQLLASNQSNSFLLSKVPPLTLLCKREKCFSLPCTGMVFDPSCRLLMAASASRAVIFLRLKPTPTLSRCDNFIRHFSRWCCPIYYLTCMSLCCPVRQLKQLPPPPQSKNKCVRFISSVTSWFYTIFLFGWLWNLCLRESTTTKTNANTSGQQSSDLISTSSLTVINLVVIALFSAVMWQFVSEAAHP